MNHSWPPQCCCSNSLHFAFFCRRPEKPPFAMQNEPALHSAEEQLGHTREADRARHLERRHAMTHEQREVALALRREQRRIMQNEMTAEELAAQRERNRLYQRQRRLNMSEEQRAMERERRRARSRQPMPGSPQHQDVLPQQPHLNVALAHKQTGKYKSYCDRWEFEKHSIISGTDPASDDSPAVDKGPHVDDVEENANTDDDRENVNVDDDVGESANVDDVRESANVDDVGEDANVDDVVEDANVDGVEENVSVSTANIGKRGLPSKHKRQHDKKKRFVKSVKDAIKGMNDRIDKIGSSADPMSFTKTLYAEVMKTEGLSMEYLDSAFAILRRDPVEAEIFLVRNVEFRKKMLEGLREKMGDL